MEKEFVPYEWAIKLKELGFDCKCFAVSTKTSEEFEITDPEDWDEAKYGDLLVKRPTFSQAFRWFREKYGFEVFLQKEVNLVSGKTYSYLIENDVEEIIKRSPSKSSIERAELDCLKKLIEIVKEK